MNFPHYFVLDIILILNTYLLTSHERKKIITGIIRPKLIDDKGFHISNACNIDDCPTMIPDAIQNVAALAFKNGGCHVIDKLVMEDIPGHFFQRRKKNAALTSHFLNHLY